jgi:hypothetical protein
LREQATIFIKTTFANGTCTVTSQQTLKMLCHFSWDLSFEGAVFQMVMGDGAILLSECQESVTDMQAL